MDATRRSPLRRFGVDRLLILSSLGLLCLLAWAYLYVLSEAMARGDMSLMGMDSMPMAGAAMSAPMAWTATTVLLMFLMWSVMMIGMMIPSALPAILLHARVQRHYRPARQAARMSAMFVLGYLVAWIAFSLVATMSQWALSATGLLSPMTMAVNSRIGAGLFAAAGLYQLSPLKNVCLRHCRSPAEFISASARPGLIGALVSGAHHGLYCVGCCWMLMVLLFAGGVMNLIWVAALALFVLLEKLAPYGHWLARASGVGMLITAAVLLAGSL